MYAQLSHPGGPVIELNMMTALAGDEHMKDERVVNKHLHTWVFEMDFSFDLIITFEQMLGFKYRI